MGELHEDVAPVTNAEEARERAASLLAKCEDKLRTNSNSINLVLGIARTYLALAKVYEIEQ